MPTVAHHQQWYFVWCVFTWTCWFLHMEAFVCFSCLGLFNNILHFGLDLPPPQIVCLLPTVWVRDFWDSSIHHFHDVPIKHNQWLICHLLHHPVMLVLLYQWNLFVIWLRQKKKFMFIITCSFPFNASDVKNKTFIFSPSLKYDK